MFHHILFYLRILLEISLEGALLCLKVQLDTFLETLFVLRFRQTTTFYTFPSLLYILILIFVWVHQNCVHC